MKERRLLGKRGPKSMRSMLSGNPVEKLFELANNADFEGSQNVWRGSAGWRRRTGTHPLSPGISRRALDRQSRLGEEARYSLVCMMASERHRNETDKRFTSYWLNTLRPEEPPASVRSSPPNRYLRLRETVYNLVIRQGRLEHTFADLV